MLIPYQQLNAETLRNVVESFVLREGTDYGEHESSLADNISQVIQQIKLGKVLIMYSELHDSVTLISQAEYQQRAESDDHEAAS